MIKKLRWKFVIINMSIVTVILTAVFAVMLSMTKAGALSDSMLVLRRAASNDNAINALSENASQMQIPFFAVDVDRSGNIVVLNGSYYDMADDTSIAAIVEASIRQESDVGMLEEFGLRYYRQATPFGVRIAFADTSFEKSMSERFVRLTLAIGGAAFLLFFGISMLLAHWAVRPVEDAWRKQKQFVEDASHELKTPLAVVLSSADLLLRQSCVKGGRPERWARNIREEALRMRALVEDMLSLARVENTAATAAATERINLSAIANDCVLQMEAAAYESGKTLLSDIEEGIFVQGVRQQLQQLTDNLLSNAVVHSSKDGGVALRLSRRGKRVLLIVENAGEPIPKERLARLFERFYRLDSARSDGGCGLGLAIAKSITERHKGRIWAENGEGTVRFVVELPCLIKDDYADL
jgi:signal transduction histidine kinase